MLTSGYSADRISGRRGVVITDLLKRRVVKNTNGAQTDCKNSKKQRKKIKVRILDSQEEDVWNGIKNKNICHTTQCNNPNPVHIHLVMTAEYAVNVAVNRTNGAL